MKGEEAPRPREAVESEYARHGLIRWTLAVLAVVSMALAVLGIVLPGLPTTPFVLLAAWAAGRSSPRLAAWLDSHPVFGPLVHDWRAGGRVRRCTKCSATVAMAVCMALLLSAAWPLAMALGVIATMALALAWLWCRPEP